MIEACATVHASLNQGARSVSRVKRRLKIEGGHIRAGGRGIGRILDKGLEGVTSRRP